MCHESRGLTISERRHVYAVEQSCLQEKGQLKEALELFAAMRRSSHFPSPSEKRRMEAAQDGFEAQLLTALGRPAEAFRLNASALERLTYDAKLSLQFQADRAWIEASLGRREEALAQASHVELRLCEPDVSRGAQVSALCSLGRAYLALEDWDRSLGAWRRCLDLKPDPVDLPKAHYFLTQTLLGLGRLDEARESLQRASEGPGELHYTRLAARELAGHAAG